MSCVVGLMRASSEKEMYTLSLVEKMELAETVGRLHVQGMNETEIAKNLNVQRKDVVLALRDWRALLKHNSETATDIRDRMLDILYEADESFRMVVKSAWDIVEEASNSGQLGAKTNALKLVESSTKSRADMLQKSGISQDDEIVEQMNEQERRQEILVGILKKARTQFPEAAEFISRELNKIQSEVEAVEIERTPAIEGGSAE